MTEKKTRKAPTKKAGAPCKYKILLQKKNWDKIEELTRRHNSRDFIARMFDVNKDTFLKALREKGFETWLQFQSYHMEGMRDKIKTKYFNRIEDEKDMSDKLLIHCMDNYVLPFEEFNQNEKDSDNVRVVYVPVADYSNPEKIQQNAENQQEDLAEQIRLHMQENGLDND